MTNRMEKFSIASIAAISLLVSGFAFANELGGGGTPVQQKQVSFEEFKDRCMNPDKYPDVQFQVPQHIVMLCESDTLDWVQDQPGSIPLAGAQVIQGAVQSDKFTVAADSQKTDIADKGGSCLRFKQIERTLKLQVPAGCGDLTKYDSVVAFCSDQALGKGGGKDTTTKDTGTVIDTCKDFPQK